MIAAKTAPHHTKYADVKKHRIYLTSKGIPFTTSSAGKRSYGAKARFVTKGGKMHKVSMGDMKNIPTAMRPACVRKAEAPTAKKPAVRKSAAVRGLPVAPSGRAREGPGAGYTEKAANGAIMRRSGRLRLKSGGPDLP